MESKNILDLFLEDSYNQKRVDFLRKLWSLLDDIEKAAVQTQENRKKGMEKFIGLSGSATALKNCGYWQEIARILKEIPKEHTQAVEDLNDAQGKIWELEDEIEDLKAETKSEI